MIRLLCLGLILTVACGCAREVTAQEEKPNPEALALIGKPAPDFKLELLDGGSMRLSDHKGKQAVIIDFWATWCPPCVAELPLIAEIVKEREGKGIVFYAVNIEEEPAEIKAFLEEKQLTHLKVPMDKDGAVSTAYLVDPLPQAVVIDRNGVVKTVLIGIKSKAEFAKEVDAALEQKN